MLALTISDIKSFMSKLLTNKTFDQFYVGDSEIVTYTTFKISGDITRDFFSTDEQEALEGRRNCLWSELRPVAFELIKGKKLPIRFKFIFQLSAKNTAWLLENNRIGISAEDVGGLFLNIKYENSSVTCITGVSLKTFTLDKSLEQLWDTTVQQFFKQNEIPFEVI